MLLSSHLPKRCQVIASAWQFFNKNTILPIKLHYCKTGLLYKYTYFLQEQSTILLEHEVHFYSKFKNKLRRAI